MRACVRSFVRATPLPIIPISLPPHPDISARSSGATTPSESATSASGTPLAGDAGADAVAATPVIIRPLRLPRPSRPLRVAIWNDNVSFEDRQKHPGKPAHVWVDGWIGWMDWMDWMDWLGWMDWMGWMGWAGMGWDGCVV